MAQRSILLPRDRRSVSFPRSKPDPPAEIRCSGCGRLLAVRHADGSLEIQCGRTGRWRSRIVVRSGGVECVGCGVEVRV